MSAEDLRKFYQFDDSDLFANRSGIITPKQRQRVYHQRRVVRNWARIVGLVLIIGDLLGFYFLWHNGLIEADIVSILNSWTIFIPLLMGVAAVWVSFSKEKEITLKSVEGKIEVVKIRSYGHGYHYYEFELHCGKEKFEANSQLAETLVKGNVYVIYYFKDSANDWVTRILSMERVGTGPAAQ
jgi:hypothetical protein